MSTKNVVTAIEKKNLVEAYETVEKLLWRKTGALIEEKRKQVSAKVWPTQLNEADEKTIFKADKRKAFKEKLKELKNKKEKKEK